MRPRQQPSDALLAVAAGQAGVLTAKQVERAGLTRAAVERLLGNGQWQHLDRALYYSRPDSPPPWLALAWAGVLLGGPFARLGGTAAAHLNGLVLDEPARVTVLVPFGEVHRSRGRWRFCRERPGVRGRSTGFPPRTSVADTVLDLCDAGDASSAVGWVTSSVQDRRTTTVQLREALRQRRRARHRQLLQDLLHDVATGAESPLEIRYLRDVERAHGLPAGRRQHEASTLPFVRDVVYLAFTLVVELDGRAGHEGAARFRDMRRDNRTLLTGSATLRYGFADVVERPCELARQVASVLQTRGWTGQPARCPRCPRCPTTIV